MHYHFYFERNWDVLSMCAWMNLTYQCIRTFVANRVTLIEPHGQRVSHP